MTKGLDIIRPRGCSLSEALDFYSISEPNSGCLLWAGYADTLGYGKLKVKNRMLFAHRVAWEQVNGPIPAGMIICHKCDVPSCINPAHLFLGTHSDNAADRVRKGRQSNARLRGALNGRARLTIKEVTAIRSDVRGQRAIAADYGVCQSHVSRIRSGDRGTWLP